MKGFAKLRTTGQSLWLNLASRDMIAMIAHLEDQSITGVSVTPEGVYRAINRSQVYDRAIMKKLKAGLVGEQLLLSLILEDVHYAADMLRHVFDRTGGVDGWAVLPTSPLISYDTDTLVSSVLALQSEVKRPNTLITVQGLPDKLAAIEEIAFAGIPCNIASIYSHDQFLGVAEAYLCGIERRIAAGLIPAVATFVSIEISKLNTAFLETMLPEKANRAAINLARKIYKTTRLLHTSQRWERAYNEGARPLRLVWVGPNIDQPPDATVELFRHLVAPLTVMVLSKNEMKELLHDWTELVPMLTGGEDKKEFADGVDYGALAVGLLEKDGAQQIKTWMTLLEAAARRSAALMDRQSATPG